MRADEQDNFSIVASTSFTADVTIEADASAKVYDSWTKILGTLGSILISANKKGAHGTDAFEQFVVDKYSLPTGFSTSDIISKLGLALRSARSERRRW